VSAPAAGTAAVRLTFDADGAAARLTLCRPPLNVLDVAGIAELNAALLSLRGRKELRALVLAAEGKAFCAGVSVEDHLPGRVGPMLAAFHDVFRGLVALNVPTIAAVQGAALGGGCELACFADLVIAADTATLGQPEIKLGVFPPVAAVCFPRRIGTARTLQLVLSGAVLDAREAERIGLVDRVVPAGELADAVAAAVSGFTDKSAAALRLTRRAVLDARDRELLSELARVEKLFVEELMATADAVEGLQSFLQKRRPSWSHH
jgi:cyclohexa-1,5-dienecarbonyl-CoA hydratase